MSEETNTLQALVDYKIEALTIIQKLDGELDSEVEAYLDQVEKDLANKVDRYVGQEEAFFEQAAKMKELGALFTKRGKAIEQLAESLRVRVKATMEKLGVKELSGNLHTYRLQNGAKKLVIDESVLAKEFWMQVIPASYDVPDTQRIKELLAEGKEIFGASLETVTYPKASISKKPKIRGNK